MISTTLHINENSTSWDSGWNDTPASAGCGYTSWTRHIIKSITIKGRSNIISSDTWTGTIQVLVNGTSVFTGTFIGYRDDTDIHPYSVNCAVTINAQDTVTIVATLATGRTTNIYYGNTTQIINIGQITNASACAEMVLDVDYVPLWTVDGQNDNYARIIAYDAIEFDEFEKDADGYPTNWAAWKLDAQNEGYPWPTGYLSIRQRGDIIKILKNGAWTETDGTVVFENGTAVPAIIKIKRSD